ncbi:MAG: hypothetical protein KC519_08425 [Anaerolineae bacterium]|nr:hypothetical protein [Anaerolineae bacterium]
MRVLGAVLLVFGWVVGVVFAQAASEAINELRRPSIAEYLEGVLAVLDHAATQPDGISRDLTLAIDQEIEHFYEDELADVDTATLYRVFEHLYDWDGGWLNRRLWINALVRSWLRESAVNLPQMSTIAIEELGLELAVEAFDFNVDGQPEFIVNIAWRGLAYTDILILDNELNHIPITVPWCGCCYPDTSVHTGRLQVERREDINADGLPEWVFVRGGVGGNHLHSGYLIILAWRDGQLVDLAQVGERDRGSNTLSFQEGAAGNQDTLAGTVHWEFKDVDGDAALEVIQIQDFFDNWDCHLQETRIFAWSSADDRYVIDGRHYDYSDTSGCQTRFAQQAMWDGDYGAAIGYFERALALDTRVDAADWSQRFAAYVQARLAIAYALVGRRQAAASLLDDLSADPFAHVLKDAFSAQNTYSLCAAAFEYFDRFKPWDEAAYYGATRDIVVPMTAITAPTLDPSRAGCDVRALPMRSAQFDPTSDGTLDEYLAHQGIPVAQKLAFDLNSDGYDEWLVFPEGPVRLALFYARWCRGGCLYRGTVLDMRSPEERGIEITTQPLPDGQQALAVYFFDWTLRELQENWWRYDMSSYGCATDDQVRRAGRGYTRLYRLSDGAIDLILDAPVCLNDDLETLFTADSRQFNGWYVIGDEAYPASYVWNDTLHAYVIASVPAPETQVSIQPDAGLNAAYVASSNGSYDEAIVILEQLVQNDAAPQGADVTIARYLLGLFYERRSRLDDALVQYVTVFQTAPDSTWGRLARLHFDVISR